MINYNFKIEALDCIINQNGLTNVIQNVHWRYIGKSNLGTSSDIYGVETLPITSPDTFTSIDLLTNEIVIVWLENIFLDRLEQMQEQIKNTIDLIENPTNRIIQL
jgi:hypothetical protein